MKKKLQILLIEDVEADFLLLSRHIRQSDLEAEIHWIREIAGLRAACERGGWDVVLSDYKVVGLDFLEALNLILEKMPGVPVILVSGSVGEETAVDLLKKGICDFVLKDRLTRLIPAIQRSLDEVAEKRKRDALEKKLALNEQLMRSVLNGTSDAIFVKDTEGRYLLCNEAAAQFVGRKVDEILGKDDSFLFQDDAARSLMELDRAIMAAGRVRTHEEWLTTQEGKEFGFLVTKGPVNDETGKVIGLFGMSRDITAGKEAERTQKFNFRLLELVHSFPDIPSLIDSFVKEIKEFVGCEAVGIRVLDHKGKIPYQAYDGFSKGFFESESPLSIESDHCMCINVIKGDTGGDLPFYTPGGSFYMNETTRFLATVSEEVKGMTRNVCNMAGYESVALVPFRSEGKVLGLIHVADRKENKVPLETVLLLEKAVMQLGTAFQRAKAEADLRESEEVLRAIIDNASGIVWVKDLQGRFLVVNSYLLKILNKSRDEVIGRTVFDLFPPQEAGERHKNDQRVLQSGIPLETEESTLLADGLHTFLSVKFPLRDHAGNIAALSAICTDITGLKRAEISLQEQEEQYRELSNEYRTLLDNVPDGIVHLSPMNEIRWINQSARKIFGLEDGEDPRGRTCHSVFCKSESVCDPCPVNQSLKTGQNTIGRLHSAGANDREVEVRAVPITSRAGKLEGVIEIVRDMTAYRKLEEQFRQAQKMESIGTLAGGIAHDFNNILSAIIGYGELALGEMAADAPGRESVGIILEAGARAAHLTKDLLLFSRKQVSQKSNIDINSIIAMVEKFIRRIIGEDIQCKTHLSKEEMTIFADAHQIEQILMNFATNARDAMPRGGDFSISTERFVIDREFIENNGFGSVGPHGLIKVSDSGKGMDRETIGKIFEPFFTTKEMGKGTGLGLAVVYGIVKDHQGYINVESEPGKGTVFKIYLPLVDVIEVGDEVKKEQLKPRGGNETILLAEDEVSVRQLLTTLLRRNGYTVIEAVDGEQAVQVFNENRDNIDILLFDLVMPKMDGVQALDLIREKRSDIKGIFLTGYAPENIRQRRLFNLKMEVMYKPVSPRELLAVIRRILDSR